MKELSHVIMFKAKELLCDLWKLIWQSNKIRTGEVSTTMRHDEESSVFILNDFYINFVQCLWDSSVIYHR